MAFISYLLNGIQEWLAYLSSLPCFIDFSEFESIFSSNIYYVTCICMKVQDTPQNRKKCMCPGCPSFPHDCSGEKLYCGVGKSACDIHVNWCVCPGCPVYVENNLKDLYYCNKEELPSGEKIRKKNSSEYSKFYETIVNIKEMAQTGQSIIRSMWSQKKIPFSFADIHFIPAQVAKIPLNSEENVDSQVVIGPKSKKPLKISSPIIISGMSYGAVSKNVKLTIAETAKNLGIAYNSGEWGILTEEIKNAKKHLIGQYATGRFGINEDIIKMVGAVEIRFGQGAYPWKWSYLPASKMTEEITKIRGLKGTEAAYSPAHHHDMKTPEEIKNKVAWLKKITGGVPVGAKIGCGNIEEDIEVLIDSEVDFISIDGFGGGTGATDYIVRENVWIPLLSALHRAVKFLKEKKVKENITLIVGWGLRDSADFTKCLALGADAVYIGTAALIAINCEQYRMCHTGKCPTGITTHIPILEKQLKVEEGVRKLSNFIEVSVKEMKEFTRIVGKNNLKKLDPQDLICLNRDLSLITGLKYIW